MGIKESWPDIEALIRYMPIAKSCESRVPRFCVSARSLYESLVFTMANEVKECTIFD